MPSIVQNWSLSPPLLASNTIPPTNIAPIRTMMSVFDRKGLDPELFGAYDRKGLGKQGADK